MKDDITPDISFADFLCTEKISALLQKQNTPDIFIHDCLESTNKTAKELALHNFKHGTTIIANEQTAGKGQYNRDFFCTKNNGIYMSLLLKPEFISLSNLSLITIFFAVAVCEAIEKLTSKNVAIKWVNDIFLKNKKICGILTEAVTDIRTNSITAIIGGIGINFAIPLNDFPPLLQNKASSLFEQEKPNISRNQLIAEIINSALFSLAFSKEDEILTQYKKRLFFLGKDVLVLDRKNKFRATALDINKAGQLIIKDTSGKVRALSSGEIILENPSSSPLE